MKSQIYKLNLKNLCYISIKLINFANKNKSKMELTISIKEQSKLAFFIKLLQEFSYIEILDINENILSIPVEHKLLLEQRLQRIINGETTFKSWDLIKEKYETAKV